jgi:hypothetical protein
MIEMKIVNQVTRIMESQKTMISNKCNNTTADSTPEEFPNPVDNGMVKFV